MEVLAKDNGQTLSQHVAKCIEVARIIIPSLPLADSEKRTLVDEVITGLAFHDCGKSALGFQKVMKGEAEDWGGKRHEIISASLASAVPNVSEAIIFAILTHHKSIPNTALAEERKALDIDSLPLDGESERWIPWKRIKREWMDNYDSFRESWIKICEMIKRPDMLGIRSPPMIRLDRRWLMRGFGSGSQLKNKSFDERRHFSLVRGLLMASDHMASGNHIPNSNSFSLQKSVDSRLRTETFVRNIHGFQHRMSETNNSVILRAPTGSGKTEAALLWAEANEQKYSRFFYVLPNIASINAMFQRLRKFFGDKSVGLLHSRAREAIYRRLTSKNDMESNLRNQETAGMLASVAHSIWFPVRVCTPHQILRFSLRGRGWETSLAEFPRALFVFDEIHAYDPRMVGQILATAKLVMRWNAKCAFLSATMPSFLVNLIKENLQTNLSSPALVLPDSKIDKELINKKRHIVIVKDGVLMDYLTDIIHDMENGLKVLVVCNTVSASQEVFTGIREILGKKFSQEALDQYIMLIHSRFTRRDRSDKEERLFNLETRPKILVSTQVVEVSLDISYDKGYFEPGPIDAMIQRMGRVNRRGEHGSPVPIYIMNQEISSHSIYLSRERIKKTLEEFSDLSQKQKPLTESDLVLAANKVYSEGYDQDEFFRFNQGINNRELRDFEEEMIAGASEDWKDKVLDDSWGVDILPRKYLRIFEQNRKDGLIIEAYSFLVPMQYSSQVVRDADRDYDPWIANHEYSSMFGFSAPLVQDPWDDEMSDKAPIDPSNVI